MVLTLLGPIVLDAVTGNSHSKGFMNIIHQTDEGYAVGQHGGQQLDKIVLEATLWGPERFVIKELLTSMADTGKPWWFISRLASFRQVKVNDFRFSDKLEVVETTITIQRVKTARYEKILQLAGGILSVVGSGIREWVVGDNERFSKGFVTKGSLFLKSLHKTVNIGIYGV